MMIVSLSSVGIATIGADLFRSQMQMTEVGFKVQPWISSHQLASYTGVRNSLHCAGRCNPQPRCQYFDYDSTTKICRIFVSGKIIATNSSGVVGKVRSSPGLYASYNQSCVTGDCQLNRYLSCDTLTNRCQCPTGLAWNSSMCVGQSLHSFVSFQSSVNFLLATLSPNGWNMTGRTVAGLTGVSNATKETLFLPESVAVDSSQTLYIVDTFNHRVQKWRANASSGTTVVGQSNGTFGYGLDSLFYPNAIVIDSMGSLYISEVANNRVIRFSNGSLIGTIVAGDGKSFAQVFQR